MENVNEGNKLIAEFAGWELFNEVRHGNKIYWWATKGISWEGQEAPSFDSHWELLMPVVEKIENTLKGGWVKITGEIGLYEYTIDHIDWDHKTIMIQNDSSKIEATWQAVIQFIQWYNKNNS